MKERVEATQALVAIDLDQRRNELVAFDLVRHEQQCLASVGQVPWLCFAGRAKRHPTCTIWPSVWCSLTRLSKLKLVSGTGGLPGADPMGLPSLQVLTIITVALASVSAFSGLMGMNL